MNQWRKKNRHTHTNTQGETASINKMGRKWMFVKVKAATGRKDLRERTVGNRGEIVVRGPEGGRQEKRLKPSGEMGWRQYLRMNKHFAIL